MYLVGQSDIVSEFYGNDGDKLKVNGSYDLYMCWVVDRYVINRDFKWCKTKN